MCARIDRRSTTADESGEEANGDGYEREATCSARNDGIYVFYLFDVNNRNLILRLIVLTSPFDTQDRHW